MPKHVTKIPIPARLAQGGNQETGTVVDRFLGRFERAVEKARESK